MSRLRDLFYKKQKLAEKMSEINVEFQRELGDTKWVNVEIPDDVVDCIDYGTSSMTFREFTQRMNEELRDQEDD